MSTLVATITVVGLLMLPMALTYAAVVPDRPVISGRAPFLFQEPRGLLWAGREFTSRPEFEGFLSARGASYETWARRHPRATPLARGPRARDLYAAWAVGVIMMFVLLVGVPRHIRTVKIAALTSAALGFAIALWANLGA